MPTQKLPKRLRPTKLRKNKNSRRMRHLCAQSYQSGTRVSTDSHRRQHAGNTQNIQATVDKETDAKLRAISQQYEKNKDAVVGKLLDRVTLVKPELHRNLNKLEA